MSIANFKLRPHRDIILVLGRKGATPTEIVDLLAGLGCETTMADVVEFVQTEGDSDPAWPPTVLVAEMRKLEQTLGDLKQAKGGPALDETEDGFARYKALVAKAEFASQYAAPGKNPEKYAAASEDLETMWLAAALAASFWRAAAGELGRLLPKSEDVDSE